MYRDQPTNRYIVIYFGHRVNHGLQRGNFDRAWFHGYLDKVVPFLPMSDEVFYRYYKKYLNKIITEPWKHN